VIKGYLGCFEFEVDVLEKSRCLGRGLGPLLPAASKV